jgi:bifunctional DNase/RNase
MTHDLLDNIIGSLGARVERIIINDIRNHTFYARIVLSLNGKIVEVDSRPSDAIALGAASGAPIFVDEQVFDKILD